METDEGIVFCIYSIINFTDKEQKDTDLWWHREARESRPKEFAEIME